MFIRTHRPVFEYEARTEEDGDSFNRFVSFFFFFFLVLTTAGSNAVAAVWHQEGGS